MKDGILALGILLSLLIRWMVSLFNYSGYGKPPMFGDYEAQRHWQEITLNLPVKNWYVNSSKNDILYWGLDYPPLTAYHSYICGYIANKINPSWVQLFTSRGFESYYHKLFMRYTVIAADILIYTTAVWAYWYHGNHRIRAKSCAVAITLLFPGLILIDHGHFQYNCVSLGLTLWAIFLLGKDWNVLGAAAFCLAINYKQMELYHALPFFCYLLGICLKSKPIDGIIRFIKLAAAVILVFLICWYPFIWNSKVFFQVIRRLFPFDRGLFEDKVANFWCSLSVIIKWKSLFSIPTLAKISLISTILAVLPSSINLLLKPSLNRFKLALINSSLVFFLFSFQVHEKSILLATLPVCLLLPYYPLPSTWFLLISVYSMFPLLIKDGLVVPCYATCGLYLILVSNAFLRSHLMKPQLENSRRFLIISFYASLAGAFILSFLSLVVRTPDRYPDLHTLLCCTYCCSHFFVFAAYFHWLQFTLTETDSPPSSFLKKIK